MIKINISGTITEFNFTDKELEQKTFNELKQGMNGELNTNIYGLGTDVSGEYTTVLNLSKIDMVRLIE